MAPGTVGRLPETVILTISYTSHRSSDGNLFWFLQRSQSSLGRRFFALMPSVLTSRWSLLAGSVVRMTPDGLQCPLMNRWPHSFLNLVKGLSGLRRLLNCWPRWRHWRHSIGRRNRSIVSLWDFQSLLAPTIRAMRVSRLRGRRLSGRWWLSTCSCHRSFLDPRLIFIWIGVHGMRTSWQMLLQMAIILMSLLADVSTWGLKTFLWTSSTSCGLPRWLSMRLVLHLIFPAPRPPLQESLTSHLGNIHLCAKGGVSTGDGVWRVSLSLIWIFCIIFVSACDIHLFYLHWYGELWLPFHIAGAMALYVWCWSCDSNQCIFPMVSIWIHVGANRTPPFDHKSIAQKGCAAFECTVGFNLCLSTLVLMMSLVVWFIYIVHCTFRRPSSHTTHSVGSTGLALWAYAVCGVWGGWVGSLEFLFLGSRRSRENFQVTTVSAFACNFDFLSWNIYFSVMSLLLHWFSNCCVVSLWFHVRWVLLFDVVFSMYIWCNSLVDVSSMFSAFLHSNHLVEAFNWRSLSSMGSEDLSYPPSQTLGGGVNWRWSMTSFSFIDLDILHYLCQCLWYSFILFALIWGVVTPISYCWSYGSLRVMLELWLQPMYFPNGFNLDSRRCKQDTTFRS